MRLREVVIWFECLASGTMAPRGVINENSKLKMDELRATLERRIFRWHRIRTPDDMQRPTAAYGLCFILLAFVIPVSIGLRSCSTPQDRLAVLINKIRAHEDALMSVVRAVQSRGEADAESKALTSKWPTVCRPRTDANGNMYFITDYNLWSNTGFVYRASDAKLLGDGIEPTIAEVEHLFGPWWRYVSN